MRCALSPAALAAATGRELLNAGVASKLPSGSGAGLLAEAAVQAAQAAAQPPGAMVSAHALADDEGAKKVRARGPAACTMAAVLLAPRCPALVARC